MSQRWRCLMLLLLTVGTTAFADEDAKVESSGDTEAAARTPTTITTAMPMTMMAPVVVSGAVSGPGLWRADRNGQTLWILGNLDPLPKHMNWEAEDVQAVLDQAGALIGPPYVMVKANVGFWGGLALAPKALGARKNPDGRTLKDLLDPAVYARWEALRSRYLGRSRKAEGWRPLFAAEKLVAAAINKSRLSDDSVVREQLIKWAKKRKKELVSSRTEFSIDDPKAMLTEFRESNIDDTACFEQTLLWLERDLDLMRARANAWADGDIVRLRELATENSKSACVDTLIKNDLFRSRGIDELPKRQRETWRRVIEETLAKHDSALALLSMDDLLGEDNYLEDLREMGFEIISPE